MKKLRNIIAGGILVLIIIILGVNIRLRNEEKNRQATQAAQESQATQPQAAQESRATQTQAAQESQATQQALQKKWATQTQTAQERQATQAAQALWDDLVVLAHNLCTGKDETIQSATFYNSDIDEIHPVLIIDQNDIRASTDYNEVKSAWKPDRIDDLQLIACVNVNPNWKTVETCDYNNGFTVYREQQSANIRIYEAKTGLLIDTFDIEAGIPRECGYIETFFNDETTKTILGDTLSPYALINELSSFVAP